MQVVTAYFPVVELAKTALGRALLRPAGISAAGKGVDAAFDPIGGDFYVDDADACARGKALAYDEPRSGRPRPNGDRVFPMEGYKDAWAYLRGPRRRHGEVAIETEA